MKQTLSTQSFSGDVKGTSSTSTIDEATTRSRVSLAVGGITCVACSRAITDAVSELEGVSDIVVSRVGNSASAVITRSNLAQAIATLIEDIGYECNIISVTPIASGRDIVGAEEKVDTPRDVALEWLEFVPSEISTLLEKIDSRIVVHQSHDRDPQNVVRISYVPSAPDFTIRTILDALSATDTGPVSVWHPPSSDEISRRMYRRDQMKLFWRLFVAVIAAIPIFIIGIVYMSLVRKDNPGRMFFEQRMWAGQVTRGEWALFILATPVMFYSAKDFHSRSVQEIWHMWKPGSRATFSTRFFRFGSMNLLISLGVTVAYFASIAELAVSASNTSHNTSHASVESSGSMTYFDSVGFLTMFLLIGKYIEAFSKHQAANAITLLGKLRGSEALLVTQHSTQSSSSVSIHSDSEIKSTSEYVESRTPRGFDSKVQKMSVDLLEVGDIVRVPPGSTPPADGIIVSSEPTHFDESSLTGESRNVVKNTGDRIFVGTINKQRAVDMRVEAVDAGTMLEQVIEAVRQGQTKPAPIERIVDVITSYFAPVVTGLAIITWIVWLVLGLSGFLAADTLSNTVGGWPFWSLEFAIAVFVIACPCGIGLAAPTALLVGSGLAAKHGILARGGGEAFQEASQIDVIVFDKTGTLTEGSEPKVTDVKSRSHPVSSENENWLGLDVDPAWVDDFIPTAVLCLASASSHPLSVSLRQHYQNKDTSAIIGSDIEELPGRGLKALLRVRHSASTLEFNALLGNETWLQEFGIVPDKDELDFLHRVKSEGKSVVVLALSVCGADIFNVAAIFAISDPIRPEVPSIISQLHAQGIETWMISGDNEMTARAVAKSVGILSENVIAGVLPQQKADKIRWLQTLPGVTNVSRGSSRRKQPTNERRIVAMVGDGINDAPALTAADVGIAMGSGSDIALSSAKFVLLSSDLRTLLVLTDLSKKIFRRIKFNFAWATVYNLIALPVAAGVIYPAGHARLGPVWSSLAMALSSTSVVCSSLLLRLYKKPRLDDVSLSDNLLKDGSKNEV